MEVKLNRRRERHSFFIFLGVLWMISNLSYAQKNTKIRSGQHKKDSIWVDVNSIPAFTIYKDNYFVTGTSFAGGKVNKYTSDAKFQISLRHRIYKGKLPYQLYLFLTYSQKSFWNLYRRSAPFADNDYNPTIGFGRNFIRDGRLRGVGMLQFEHESNGRDSIWSRSWNKISLIGLYAIDNNFTVQAKLFIPVGVADENHNIVRYAGYGHIVGTYSSNNRRLSCSVMMIKRGGWNLNANWQLEVAYKIFPLDNQYFCMQFYNGYGESMLKYNHFSRYIRFGIVIKPNFISVF